MELEEELQPPEDFPFPFQPYGIQRQFMHSLYVALEKGCVGIFESPTGTGKSLSLICSALRWLEDSERRERERTEVVLAGKVPPLLLGASSGGVSGTNSDATSSEKGTNSTSTARNSAEPDWFAAYDQQKAQDEAIHKLKEKMELKAKREERLKRLKEEYGSARWRVKKKEGSPSSKDIDKLLKEGSCDPNDCHGNTDDDIIVAEYFSDDESKKEENSDSEEEIDEEHVRKIYYCSRTHSQLAQFVREVQKSPYGDRIHVVTLGSRQNLCINEEVTRLKSLALINDRCLELQKNKKKETERKQTADGQPKEKRKRPNKAAGCPFYKPGPLESFRDLALAEVQDIEQLVSMGRELKACPYYGVRYAIPAAQLVVLPYNTLLHTPTREAVGVKLRGNIIIIDEAHNLLDTISNVYSVEVTGAHVAKAHSQLSQYLERYRSRLKAKNLMYINQILHVLSCFIKVLEPKKSTNPECSSEREAASASVEATAGDDARLLRLNDFLFSANVDNVNLFKVLRYCERSQISKKLNGFVDRYFEATMGSKESTGESSSMKRGKKAHKHQTVPTPHAPPTPGVDQTSHQVNSPLMLLESFLEALTNADKDGRIVVTKKGLLSTSSLKFLLLNPSVHFSSIVQEARAVIVAGGTMQPVAEFKEQLLFSAGVSTERIMEFTCGHVIPPDHLLPLCLCKGPSGVPFDFTFRNRDNTTLMDELGRTLVNLCTVVPGGVVCFFPSYEYERKLHTHWNKTGVLEKINRKKQVFREPKLASQVESVLSQYTRCIEFNAGSGGREGVTGALMLCVVGGKLSEGINFSDDLGRCIVMVGLPYPNIKSPELVEKMEYLNSTMPKYPDGRLPGQVHYENLCMKAVNQSIGRSIRHAGDFACIVLVDQRYARPSVCGKLPEWIGSQLHVCQGFGQAFAAVRKFFVSKRNKDR